MLNAYIPECEADNDTLRGFLFAGSRVITIVGDLGAKRTGFAVSLLHEVIVRYHRSALVPSEFNFRYMNAPDSFEEMFTQRFREDDNTRPVMLSAQCLVLDDLDLLDDRYMKQVPQIIKSRFDKGAVTIVGVSSAALAQLEATVIEPLLIDGQTIVL